MRSLLTRALRYHLFPGRPLSFPDVDLHNEVYRFWKGFWTSVLRDNGTDDKIDEADFRRMDRIGVLLQGRKPVALIGHTFFDLAHLSERDHSYFKHLYNEEFMRGLEERGVRRIMTEEYLAVLQDWRKAKINVSLATVLIGLGLKLAQSEGVEAVVTVPREDIGMDLRVIEQGAVRLQGGIDRHNTPCSLVAFFPDTIRLPPDDAASDLVSYFWANRMDETSLRPAEEGMRQAA